MPPSSNRRTRTRKLPEQQEKSDVDDMDEISTPTRKRRRVSLRRGTALNAERVAFG